VSHTNTGRPTTSVRPCAHPARCQRPRNHRAACSDRPINRASCGIDTAYCSATQRNNRRSRSVARTSPASARRAGRGTVWGSVLIHAPSAVMGVHDDEQQERELSPPAGVVPGVNALVYALGTNDSVARAAADRGRPSSRRHAARAPRGPRHRAGEPRAPSRPQRCDLRPRRAWPGQPDLDDRSAGPRRPRRLPG